MKLARLPKTKKGAASVYIVIFTTTLLAIISLSFVRIMLAESLRTTNYSLSQSAYNSAMAGIEDAKIVLLRYQNCINGTAASNIDCDKYKNSFGDSLNAMQTAQNCDKLRELLYGNTQSKDQNETIIRTGDTTPDASVIDQAYTCVKISSYTDDYITSMNHDNSVRIIPLRAENQAAQDSINRISIQWFSTENYSDVSNNSLKLSNEYFGNDSPEKSGSRTVKLNGAISENRPSTWKMSTVKANYDIAANKNSFPAVTGTVKGVVPPVLQATFMQTGQTYNLNDFYTGSAVSNATDASGKHLDRDSSGKPGTTNRGTLMFRPTDDKTVHNGSANNSSNGNSNHLPENSLWASTKKSINTPMDVYCRPGDGDWADGYACRADFYVPKPFNANERNMATTFLVLNLPYGDPETEVRVQMLSCADSANNLYDIDSNNKLLCKTVQFANVQPAVDSTGRANDLFRRVEARIELVDTYFPIANYALATTDPNGQGIVKNFYATDDCYFTSSYAMDDNGTPKVVAAEYWVQKKNNIEYDHYQSVNLRYNDFPYQPSINPNQIRGQVQCRNSSSASN